MPSLHVVDLRKTPQGSLLSMPVQESIDACLEGDKRVLIYHNKRGEGSVFTCKKCSYIHTCKYCEIPLRVHTYPNSKLLCHQCNYVEQIFESCPKCSSEEMDSNGIRIQNISSFLQQKYSSRSLCRVDTDNQDISFQDIENADIVLATSQIFSYPVSSFDVVVFVLFESDLIVSDFSIEEKTLLTYKYLQALCKNKMYIQTFLPEMSFLQSCISAGYKENMSHILSQRKMLGYPPHQNLITIRIENASKEKLSSLLFSIVSKLYHNLSSEYVLPEDLKKRKLRLRHDNTDIWYDVDMFSKFAGKWQQKIIVKGKNSANLVKTIEKELFKNSGIYVERYI